MEQKKGKVKLLRVHELGTGYGPQNDYLDAEVIIWLESTPGSAYGFQLRQGDHLPAHEGMFQLLLTAYRNQWQVVMDVDEKPGRKNHRIVRIWVQNN